MENNSNSSKFLDEFNILEIVKALIVFVFKARKFIIIATILAIISAYITYKVSDPIYESTMTAYSVNLQDTKAVSLISDLEKYLEDKDYEELSRKTGISIGKLEKLKSLKASVEVNKYKTFQEEATKDGFSVKVKVTDNTILDSLGWGIKSYIENSEYVNDQIRTFRISLQYNITKTEEELKDLDSLKTSLYKMVSKRGETRSGSNLILSDISYISSKSVELSDRLSTLRQQLALSSDIKIIKQFSKFKKKSAPKLLPLFITYFVIYQITALLIFFYKANRTLIQSAIREQAELYELQKH